MPKRPPEDKPANLNLRNIPRNTFYRLKMAAAAEQRTVKDLILALIEEKLLDLEKKGILPKSK
jgi:plasmid stability protein